MATLAQTEARLRRLETRAVTSRPWLRAIGLPRQSVEQTRMVLRMAIEHGMFLPSAHASTAEGEAERRRMAQALWPDQYTE